jgi:putative transposase
MARKPRIYYPGALYHVILRGNARQDIFFSDQDRCRFLLLLQEGVERFGHRIHAFCLMTNHIHLALQVGNVPLSRILQNLSFRYTRWCNWRRNKSGHLFQGRYKAVLVDADAYLVQLAGYIHLNPVRSGMAPAASDYPWSSHRAYLGEETIPWLSTEPVLALFSNTLPKARSLFGTFVDERRKEGHREEFHRGAAGDGRVLGEDDFVETVLRQAGSEPLKKPTIEAVIRALASLYDLRDGELASAGQGVRISEARAMAAWAVQELSGATITELGVKIGRDVTSLSSAVRRLRERSIRDERVAEKMLQLKEVIDGFASLQA